MKYSNLKGAIVAAALAAVPLGASAGLAPVSDERLAGVVGQEGLTIDASLNLTIEQVAITDDDGYDGAAGAITMTNVRLYGTDGPSSMVVLEGMTIDSDGDRGLVIGLPNIEGNIDVEGLALGTGDSIGGMSISGLAMAGSTITIRGH